MSGGTGDGRQEEEDKDSEEDKEEEGERQERTFLDFFYFFDFLVATRRPSEGKPKLREDLHAWLMPP